MLCSPRTPLLAPVLVRDFRGDGDREHAMLGFVGWERDYGLMVARPGVGSGLNRELEPLARLKRNYSNPKGRVVYLRLLHAVPFTLAVEGDEDIPSRCSSHGSEFDLVRDDLDDGLDHAE